MKDKVINFVRNNKKKVILASVIIIFAIILGVTLAFMRARVQDENKTNVALNSCAKITLLEKSDSINLTNVAPMSDNRGMNTEPYQFTVTNSCDESFYYTMYIGVAASSSLDASDIKYVITDEENDVIKKGIVGEQSEATSTFNSAEISQLTTAVGTTKAIYGIMTSGLAGKSERTYNLYLWVDSDVETDTMNQSFNAGFMVKADSIYKSPSVTKVTVTPSMTSAEVRVLAKNGDYEVEKFHYYMNGEKIGESKTSYTITGLTKGTEYQVDIVIEDASNYFSSVYSVKFTTNTEGYLAEYIKDTYTIDGNNGLYLHDADLANGANDGSYRYAGASEDVNNYVCFGSDAEVCPDDNLYRIIGVFGEQVKLIKYDYATGAQLGTDGSYYGTYTYGSTTYKGTNYANIVTYTWSSDYSNTWSASSLNTVNLNTNYINYLSKIDGKWTNMIETTTWKVGGSKQANIMSAAMNVAYQNEIVNPAESTTYKDKIGLMYVSDYGYAASPAYWTYKGSDTATTDYRAASRSNWMYMGLYDFTITPLSSGVQAFGIRPDGRVYNSDVSLDSAIRPTFYLKSTVKYNGKGDGTKNSPYRLSDLEQFSKYITSKYTTDGENGLYLHDADLTNGTNNGNYRYSGSSAEVKNYVCFGSDATTCPEDNLYRIIGIFEDEVKLIKSDYATSEHLGTDGAYYGDYTTGSDDYKGTNYDNIDSYFWDGVNSESIWANTDLNTVNLNINFINYLNGKGSKWKNMIAETTWQVGGNTRENLRDYAVKSVYQNEIVSPVADTTFVDEIGLMYASDYGYAARPSYWTTILYEYDDVIDNNWLHMGLYEWMITRSTTYTNYAFNIIPGGAINNRKMNFNQAVRPVFNLKSGIRYAGEGDGSKESPYRIVEPKVISFKINENQIGTSNVVTHEYKAINGMTWRQWIESSYYNNDVIKAIFSEFLTNNVYFLTMGQNNVKYYDEIWPDYTYNIYKD